jgi:hypothetical protein
MTGILLIAFGKAGYARMAHNLAFTLKKHAPDLKIGLYIADDIRQFLPDPSLFHAIKTLNRGDYKNARGGIEPAKAKGQIYRFGTAMFDKFLYLDVDGIGITDIRPLLKHLEGRPVATEITGTGKVGQHINYGEYWCSAANIVKHFGCSTDATICGVQSSWMYFEKGLIGEKVQEYLDYYLTKPLPKHIIKADWGGSIPDEMLYQGVFAKMGIVPRNPKGHNRAPVFFGHANIKDTPEQVRERYHVLALYGFRLVQKRYLALADKLLKEAGDRHGFTTDRVMKDKHVA